MKSVVIGTAGHIDHGKSSLVKALTGTDPDRWEEEQRRGITIDLGFAHLTIGDIQLAFVDVPGHERFVKNMLAGAGGIDIVLFVVAADESIKPQTREHFDICRLLGVRRGLVALTKCDLVDADLRGLVRMEVEEFVAGSFLEGAPVIPVSARTGEGLDMLKAELGRLAAETVAKDSSRPLRLPIDRAFVMKGFGTVVTGTLIAGTLDREAEVEIYPAGKKARVRGLQTHNQAEDRAFAGQRTAVNLAGVDAAELERGMVLAEPGRFRPTQRLDTRVHLLRTARPLKNRAPVHFHSGTAETVAEVLLLAGAETIAPASSAFAQLRLRDPALLLPGDRFILRQFSPVTTIGGGVVLDNLAAKHRRDEDLDGFFKSLECGNREQVLQALLARSRRGEEASTLLARTGWTDQELRVAAAHAAVVSESPLVLADRGWFAQVQTALLDEVKRFHAANPLLPGIPREDLRDRVSRGAHAAVFDSALAQQVRAGAVETAGDIVRVAGRRVVLAEDETRAKQQIAAAFLEAGLATPAMKEVLAKVPVEPARAQKILQILLKEGELVRVTTDMVFHRSALEQLRAMLAEQKKKSDRLNVGVFKELTGITRKYAIPLLEYLDRERVTRRVGEERVIL